MEIDLKLKGKKYFFYSKYALRFNGFVKKNNGL